MGRQKDKRKDKQTKTQKPAQCAGSEKMSACVCFNFRRAARAITRVYDEELRPTGLRATQLSILAVLVHAGELGILDLATVMATERTTLTRNLGPLRQQGLLSVRPGRDKRSRLVSITKKGRKDFTNALPHWQRAQERMTGLIGPDRWAEMLGDLQGTVARLGQGA